MKEYKIPKEFVIITTNKIAQSIEDDISEILPMVDTENSKIELLALKEKKSLLEKRLMDELNNYNPKSNNLKICLYEFTNHADEVSNFKKEFYSSVCKENTQYRGFINSSSLKNLFVEYSCLSKIMVDLLESVKQNVHSASDPLSSGIYEIKKSISEFAGTVNSWQNELTSKESEINFDTIIADFEKQKIIFKDLTAIINTIDVDLKNNLDKLASMILKIEKNTGEISDTAGKIQVLSLNASIEAAHAGIHGRGFKVIANETKKLSEQTNILVSNIVLEVSNTKLTLNNIIEEKKTGWKSISEKLDMQDTGLSGFHSALDGYHNHFNIIFSTVNEVTKKIFTQLDNISPTFQLHDLISQEIGNTKTLIGDFSDKYNSDFNGIKDFFAVENEKDIIDNFIKFIEKQITTDNEVDVLTKHIKNYGLNRTIDLQKGNMDIELF